ncbi:uncharacterized protein AB675_1007 [Cyphellophora attinorum]|uniref:Uncharacterized protein n=1 Tax=Cyphellophora attinorum TaxID=1664694 RepID=A0A0N1NY69_9EURO|nr:uncharacterized protein AB675_1007 [Phialophora attinorum]KPI38202.1 hypothetical protein AB675_1007 [Phialophora attinorum]
MAPFITLRLRFPTSVKMEKRASLPALLEAVNAAQQQETATLAALLDAVNDAAKQLETQLVLANDPASSAHHPIRAKNSPIHAKDPYETEDEYSSKNEYSREEKHAAQALLDLPVDRRSRFPAQSLVDDYRHVLELRVPTPPQESAEGKWREIKQERPARLSGGMEVEVSTLSRTLSPQGSGFCGPQYPDNWLRYSTDHKYGVSIKEATVPPLGREYARREDTGKLIPPENVREVLKHGVPTAAWDIAQLELDDPWEKKDYWAQDAEKRLRAKQAKERRNGAKQLSGARVHVDEMHNREQETLGTKRERKRKKHFSSVDEDKENESPMKKLKRLWPKKLERWPPERQ